MLRASLAAVGTTLALVTATPSFAQLQAPPATEQSEAQFMNVPVYSSDGEHLGRVIEVAMADGQLRGVRAEFGDAAGAGSARVLIGAEILEQKGDRLEVKMTGEQVRDVIAKQKQQK